LKAIRIHAFGDESALRYEDVPDPEIGPGDVLIRMRASALNRGDLGQREGSYAPNRRLPAIIGWDVAGVIEQVGAEVTDRRVGDRVVVLVPRGGYAELVAAPAAKTVPIPDNVTDEEAASLPSAYLTAWYPMTVVSPVRSGETALVQAGASGVGVAGIEIGKYLGARVIATAGSEAKLQFCRDYGADHAIEYQTQDFVEETLRLTDGRGVDFVLEQVGGDVLSRSVACLAPGGRLITVGNTVRQTATIDPFLLLRKSLTLRGYFLPGEPDQPGGLKQVIDLVTAGKLRTAVDQVFPLAEAAAAHRHLAERQNLGKVLLRP
jgi:NADPH:quinone reductase-like Zn-dependent oxidoreductase